MNSLRHILLASLAISGPLVADTFRLPFEGRWFVGQGGDTPNVNQHMAARALPQLYAIDFMKVGGTSGRQLNTGDGKQVSDYFSWDQPVLAPCDGEAIAAIDEFPDNKIGETDKAHPAGNHVVIKTADGKFVFVAHLRSHSMKVKTGDRVKAGQQLGNCGNSGNTTAPHVHLHVQDTADLKAGMGQNIEFTGIDVDLSGKHFDNVTWPLIRGLFVENHPSAFR